MSILAECPLCHRKITVKKKTCKCGGDMDKMKRGQKVKFWIDYRLPNGKQKREAVFGEGLNPYSIEDARKAHSKRVVQKAENRILDIKQDTRMTFNELTEWYLELEKVKALSSFWRVELCLKKFNWVFGNIIVSRVKPADLENYQMKRKNEDKADATVDQEIGTAKTMIIKAFDNGMVSGDTLRTFKVVKKLLKRGTDVRDRILTQDEFDRICEQSVKHIRDILSMAYFTGMRRGEILSLTWNKVDMKTRFINLEAEDTKDKEKRSIPICSELYETLKSIPRNLHEPHVFTFRGAPISDIRTGIRKACKKAGVKYGRFVKDGFIFHDLRHTFNTNMRKADVQESVIMAITGHSTREMFDRYNTVDREDTQAALDKLEGFFANVDQTVDQEAQIDNN